MTFHLEEKQRTLAKLLRSQSIVDRKKKTASGRGSARVGISLMTFHLEEKQRTLAKLLRSQSIVDRKKKTDSDEASEDVMSKGVPRPPDEAPPESEHRVFLYAKIHQKIL